MGTYCNGEEGDPIPPLTVFTLCNLKTSYPNIRLTSTIEYFCEPASWIGFGVAGHPLSVRESKQQGVFIQRGSINPYFKELPLSQFILISFWGAGAYLPWTCCSSAHVQPSIHQTFLYFKTVGFVIELVNTNADQAHCSCWLICPKGAFKIF